MNIDFLTIWSCIVYLPWLVLYLMLTYVFIILIYELSYYFAVKRYENVSGVSTYYSFFGGLSGLMFTGKGNDQFADLTEVTSKFSDSHMIVSNFAGSRFGSPHHCLISNEAIRDFFRKEVDVSIKQIEILEWTNFVLGFTAASGQDGLKGRSVFTEFFIYENLQALHEPMYQIMEKKFNDFVQKMNITNKEFTQINLKRFLDTVMLDWTSLLLFGYGSSSELNIDLTKYPEVTKKKSLSDIFENKKEMNIVYMLSKMCSISVDILFEPLNNMLGGWPLYFGIKEIYRNQKVLKKFVDKIISDLYEKRYNEYSKSNTKSRSMNIIDLIVEHNHDCAKENNYKDILCNKKIVGDITAFLFAGSDTSLLTSISGIMHIAQNHQDIISKLRKEGLQDLDGIKKNNYLDLVMKEVLRLYNPTLTCFPRLLIKDAEFAGIKCRKGSIVVVPTGLVRWNKKYIDAKKFRPERFETEVPNLQRFDYLPFLAGKRKCLGYSLAEMNVKILMGYLINKLEMEVPEKHEIKMRTNGLYQCVNPMVNIKLKN